MVVHSEDYLSAYFIFQPLSHHTSFVADLRAATGCGDIPDQIVWRPDGLILVTPHLAVGAGVARASARSHLDRKLQSASSGTPPYLAMTAAPLSET